MEAQLMEASDKRSRADAAKAFLVPAATFLVVVALLGAGLRLLVVVAVPSLVFGVVAHRLPRSVGSAVALLLGVLALGSGLVARSELLVAAGLLYLVAGLIRGWGVNGARSRGRAWTYRVLAAVGAILVAVFVVYPTLLAVDYLAKPRAPIDEAALGLRHEGVAFRASDGVRLSGWYIPSRNGAAIVLVHGGGGDRQGTVRHAWMLARAGYGVLLYDARGRGRSAGNENAAGWEWDRDVRGAVAYLASRRVRRIGLLGLSTGAEAVVTEAASDPRVGAVVADGLQGRTSADASHLGFGNRVSLQPAFAVLGVEIQLARGQAQPRPLFDLVYEVARTRPLLLVGTVPFEREFDRAYSRGTTARLWEVPRSAHTQALRDNPEGYRGRVLALFHRALR